MDQINSNPYFNSARIYQNHQTQQKPSTPVQNTAAATEANRAAPEKAAGSDYSTLFDDDALLKLQSNLEAIAQMAEQSLKQIDD